MAAELGPGALCAGVPRQRVDAEVLRRLTAEDLRELGIASIGRRARSRRVRHYMSAQVHWVLGYPDKALAIGSQALALAEHVAHPLSLEFVLIFNAMLHVDLGEPELALQRVESAEALVAEQRRSVEPGWNGATDHWISFGSVNAI